MSIFFSYKNNAKAKIKNPDSSYFVKRLKRNIELAKLNSKINILKEVYTSYFFTKIVIKDLFLDYFRA